MNFVSVFADSTLDPHVILLVLVHCDSFLLSFTILVGCGLAKTDLVIILDASTSVTEGNFQKMRDFVKDFLGSADVNSGSVRVGIMTYSTEVQVIFHLNE